MLQLSWVSAEGTRMLAALSKNTETFLRCCAMPKPIAFSNASFRVQSARKFSRLGCRDANSSSEKTCDASASRFGIGRLVSISTPTDWAQTAMITLASEWATLKEGPAWRDGLPKEPVLN